MNNKLILLALLIFTNIALSYSQMTIGSTEKPVEGALLQLKENENTGVNATKGLMLPRVELIDKSTLTIDDQSEIATYIGTVVYNTKTIITGDESRLCPGIHAWDGKEWIPVSPYEPIIKGASLAGPRADFVDPRDGNVYHTARFYSSKTYYDCSSTPPQIIDAGIWMTQNLQLTDGLTYGIADYTSANYYTPGTSTTTSDRMKQNGQLYGWAVASDGKGGTDGSGNINNSPTYANIDEGAGTVDGAKQVRTKGICPDGWHLPSATEWQTLKEALALQPELYSTQSTATSDAEIASVFISTVNSGKSKSAAEGGIDLVFSGFTNSTTGTNVSYDISGYYWTSSDMGLPNNSWKILIDATKFDISGSARNNMFSVRCKKNSNN